MKRENTFIRITIELAIGLALLGGLLFINPAHSVLRSSAAASQDEFAGKAQRRGGRSATQPQPDEKLKDAWLEPVKEDDTSAASQNQSELSASPDEQTVELKTDDGSIEGGYLSNGLLMVNRLTPASYPATLQKVRFLFVRFQNQPDPTGQPITIFVTEDPSGAGKPPAISQFARIIATVPGVSGTNFFELTLNTGPTINSGDFYIGYQAGTPHQGLGFAVDENSQHTSRGFFSTDNGATFSLLAPRSGATSANLMMRGIASVSSQGGGPTLSAITPNSAGAGSKGVMKITGSGFTAVPTVMFNGQPVTTSFVNATELNAVVLADQIPQAGNVSVKVVNPDGKESNAMMFNVTPAASDAEIEPNHTRTTADSLPIGGKRTGRAAAGDAFSESYDYGNGTKDPIEDFFSFRLAQASQIEIILTAPPNGDLDMFLFREEGASLKEVQTSIWDTALAGHSTERIRAALQPGRYMVGVSAFSGGSNYTISASVPAMVALTAGSFTDDNGIAPQSIATAFGANLATGLESATTQPLPTSLAGTTMKIKDAGGVESSAQFFFASPNQINFYVPAGVAPGLATLTVTTDNRHS